MDHRKVGRVFESEFSTDYLLVRAPGRINLIGEHTDYNQGMVFPAAVGHEINFAIGKSSSDTCTLIALDTNERYEFRLSEIRPLPTNSWQNYILGVVSEIVKSGKMFGAFNLVFGGDVPKGAGMSSSAALECGTCFGLNELFDLQISKISMIHMSQMAEHNYAQVKCGIMDQFASVMGKKDHAFTLDCKTLDYSYSPVLLDEYQLMLLNTNVSHNLASSEYNTRRAQCEEGVEILGRRFEGIASLRDANWEQLSQVRSELSEVVFRRCKYILDENARVLRFAKALAEGNLQQCGALLNEAQIGMRDEYEITCPEIDFLVSHTLESSKVLGARMMGGGFGGCTLNLIERGAADQIVESLGTKYQEQFGHQLTPIEVSLADGVSLKDEGS